MQPKGGGFDQEVVSKISSPLLMVFVVSSNRWNLYRHSPKGVRAKGGEET